MRMFSILLAFFCLHYSVNATTVLPPTKSFPNEKEMMIPLIGTDKFVTVDEFLKMSPRVYKKMTGKKLNLDQRIDFAFSKLILKKMIRKNGKVDAAALNQKGLFSGWHWHWGGFALGLFLSILGPIIALFFYDEYKWDRFWTALHTSVWIALIFLALAAASVAAV